MEYRKQPLTKLQKVEAKTKFICDKTFKGAINGRLMVARLNIALENEGFSPSNTTFCEGMCSDELNEPECEQMESYWGNRFKYGGLAGYCHGGCTGVQLALDSVPTNTGSNSQNIIMYGGPHIGCETVSLS